MIKKIKIGYFADGPWSHNAFKMINNDDSMEILFIVPRTNSSDKVLKNLALENRIDYLENIKVNSETFYKKAKKYDCDLFVSMSFNQIFKNKIINLPKYKTINCHAGRLPFYRGRNVLNWVLINGEKEFGITVHYIDEGIDTGDIILQKTFKILENDNYQSLLEKSYSECAVILYDAVKLVQSKKVIKIRQETIDPIGSYCRRRVDGDEYINWNHKARDIFNFIRAISYPGPLARTFYKNDLLKINNAIIHNKKVKLNYKPGQVIERTKRGYLIMCSDKLLEIFSKTNLKIGVILKNNLK